MILAVGFVLLLIPIAIIYCIYQCLQEIREVRKADTERQAQYEKMKAFKKQLDDDEHTII